MSTRRLQFRRQPPKNASFWRFHIPSNYHVFNDRQRINFFVNMLDICILVFRNNLERRHVTQHKLHTKIFVDMDQDFWDLGRKFIQIAFLDEKTLRTHFFQFPEERMTLPVPKRNVHFLVNQTIVVLRETLHFGSQTGSQTSISYTNTYQNLQKNNGFASFEYLP